MARRTLKDGQFAELEYWVDGEGPAIVWIHGFAEDIRIWDRIRSTPLPHVTHIHLNLPGTGQSPLPQNTLSIQAMAQAVNDILIQEKQTQCIWLGHSMGGYIGIAFAELFPEKLIGLGFIHSSVYADDEVKKANRLKAINIIRAGGKAHFLQQVVASLYSSDSQINMPERIRDHFDMAMTIPDETLIQYYSAMIARANHTETLKRLECPVLFVLGEFDQAVPLSVGLEQSLLPAVTSVHILAHIGHTAMNECPEKLLKILNNYCQYALRLKKS